MATRAAAKYRDGFSIPMKLMMVAGELSGDVHGAAILSSLQPLIPDLNAFGIGGAKMVAAGFTSHVPISDMQARGFVEVLRNLPKHLRILRQAITLLERERPTALLLIDYPGFNLKLAEAAKRRGVPVIYYSAPQLWAWHGSRMRTVVRTVSKMIVLFPFELTLYREAGVDAVFLGHPLVGEGAAPAEVDALKARLELH
ncbi:MAG: lipid-A-disaccharide synthase, partial [SAR324 cluster bacterium]|nr:lipid-A-disaccharide synthase [SAR324 cluster bacterium]